MRLKNYSTILLLTVACFAMLKLNAQQLQPKTLVQIQALLNEKRSRTGAERKIKSDLLQAVREKQNIVMAQGVQLKKANVNADAFGNLKVDINGDITDELLAKIQNLGGKIIYPSAEYHTVRAMINLSSVKAIAGFSEVNFIQPAAEYRLEDNNINALLVDKQNKKHEDDLRKRLISYLQKNRFNKLNGKATNSPVTSEGDRTHRVDDARNAYGYSGEGIKIGVLSDSYNAGGGATQDILNGDLPGTNNPLGHTTPVTVIRDDASGNDEGRAMLHIVHDLVPRAQLFFATADFSEANFANNIKVLRNTYHCDVIIDDVEYLDEPPFEDGMIAQAVNAVTADGALYFSSAGNYGSLTKNTYAVFEGDFNDKGSPKFLDTVNHTTKLGSIHNFGTQAQPVIGDAVLNAGSSSPYFLEWADPLGKSSNDYDLFLINNKDSVIASSTDIQDGSQDPVEGFRTNVSSGDKLVVFKDSSANPRAFRLNAGFASEGVQGLSIGTNGQTFGHNCAANAFSVAATPAEVPFSDETVVGPYPNAFDTTNQVETFSSDGPRRIFYNADTTSVTPGNFLFSTGGGLIRNKPDVTAADGVSTQTTNETFFDPFYGTSAATPHAGAIAALLKSANPDLTAAEIKALLISTALDIEAKGDDDVSGHGILQAFQAMQKLNPKPYAVVNLDTAYTFDGNISNHNGFVEPGEQGYLIAGLSDISLLAATKVTAKLSTSASGITILNDSSIYGKLDSTSGVVLNVAHPFLFKVNSSVACGTEVQFTITITYSGGKAASKIFNYYLTVGAQPYKKITAKLGTPKAGSGYVISTGKQTGRIGRYLYQGSVCGTVIANPGISGAAGLGLRTYDAYVFTNITSLSQCITATLNTSNYDSLYSVAYDSTGFVPATPNLHFIAEPQLTAGPFSYSFDVSAGKSFTVVVHEVYPGTFAGKPYTLGVSLTTCAQSVLAVDVFNLIAQADQAKQQIPLHWAVANDQQIHFYDVQRSIDGIHFSSLQTIQSALSATNKTYDYTDKTPNYGDNYYRIQKVDVNGVVTYSNIVKAAINLISDVMIMPNPAEAYLNIISKANISRIQLFDSKGQLLRTIQSQNNFYKLETGTLAAGEYFLRIQTNNAVINKKFIKQ